MQTQLQIGLLIFMATTTLTLASGPTARAQAEQDGMGRVEYDDGGSDPLPPSVAAPREVRSAPSAPIRARNGQPVVGRRAAEKYMAPKKQANEGKRESDDEKHIMTVHIGSFANDHAYKWGGNALNNVGKLNLGLSYRFGEWTNVADLGGAVEYTTYTLRGSNAQKLTFMPTITLPDVSSHFPIYFGLGAGLGIFTKQLHGESSFALDYTVFAGVRFLNVFQNTGFYAETALKSHLLLFSDGQFNGWLITLGAIFAF